MSENTTTEEKGGAEGLAEIKAVAAEIKSVVDKYREEAKSMDAAQREEFKAELAKLVEKQGKIDDAVGKIDKLIAEKGIAGLLGGDHKAEAKTIAAAFMESPQYKSFIEGGGLGDIKMAVQLSGVKSNVGTTSTIEGRQPTFRAEIIGGRDRMAQVRGLFTTVAASSNAVETVRETGFAAIWAEVASEAAAAQKDIVVDSAVGYVPGSTITLLHTNGTTTEDRVIDTVDLDTNTITVTVNLTGTYPIGSEVTSNEYGFTPEANLKPRAVIDVENVVANVKTIATFVEMTRQVLADTAQLEDYIERRLAARHAINIERELLSGPGGAGHLDGITTDLGIETYAWSNGTAGDGRADAVLFGMTAVAISEFSAEAVVMNDTTWSKIVTEKSSSDGHYLNQGISVSGTNPTLWGRPVILSPKMANDKVLVGNFTLGATVWDREQPSLRVTDSHSDNFRKNITAMIYEERLAFTVDRPEAFCLVTLDAKPT